MLVPATPPAALRRNWHTQLITRGAGWRASTAGPATVIIEVGPAFWNFAPLFQSGVHGVIARTRSYPPEALHSKIKHFSRMNFHLAELEATSIPRGGRF